MTPSAVTPSAASASSRPFIPVTDDPGAASIIAETMTKTKEVRGLSLTFYFSIIIIIIFIYLFFLPHQQHAEIPGLGIKCMPQQ